jgi:putative hydrolase of the HAD superfamily
MSQTSAPTPRAVIFDADGVLITPPQLFSRVYCALRGWPADHLDPFFAAEFQEALCGRADLKELLLSSPLWDFTGDPQTLLDQWFASEHHLNLPLLELIPHLRAGGTPVYLATNQEQYRAGYFRQVMFPDSFDDYFISSELGVVKNQDKFWRHLRGRLTESNPGLQPSEIIFFDDSPEHIDAALRAGVRAHLYRDYDQVASLMAVPAPLTDRTK